MFIRNDYINGKVTHRQYYGQFVNEATKKRVIESIGIDKLLNSKDEHLNDIPLKKWDLLGGFIWKVRGGEEIAVMQPHSSEDILPIDYKLLKEAGEGVSSSTMVCIYKEAGKQIIEELKKH